MARDEAAFLKLARDRFAQAESADHKQRQRELDDLRFYAGDQWPEAIKSARAGTPAEGGLPPVPDRPCFVINKQREPVRQILNAERQADMGIELVPADDFGELGPAIADTEIELREGLLRRIQRASEASDARTWAFVRSTIAGRGFYSVMTRYLPGKTMDQEIYVHRLYNQASVSLDPAHEQPDGSDAEWGFIGTDMPWAQYAAEFPTIASKNGRARTNRLLDSSEAEFRALGDAYPDWFTSEGETRACRVVDYWYTERVPHTLAVLADGTLAWETDLSEGAVIQDTREVIEKQIKWAKIDGHQILDETDWPGPDLPIVKVLGEELQPYDHERRSEGMIRPSRDSQQGFNAMISRWVEVIGYAPIPPPQVTLTQVQGFEAWYQAATTRMLPYLPFTPDPQNPGRPERETVTTPIEAIAASVQVFDQAIKSTTGVPDPNLGRQDPSVKSGKMALALIAQSQHGTSNYLDNLRRSIRYEGQIINNLLYPIYGKPGRLVRIMTGEGESQTIRIGDSARASAPPPPTPAGLPSPLGAQVAPKVFQLTKEASFNVIVKVTRAFDSRREEEASILGDLLSANPVFMTWFGDLFFKQQDGPGHAQMADRAAIMLDPKIQAMLAQKGQAQPVPPQAMAQLAQLQQQLQAAEQVIAAAKQEQESKQLELQAKAHMVAQAEDMKGTFQLELARIRAEAQIAVAEITKGVDVFLAERDRIGVPAAQVSAQAHEAALGAAEASHQQQLGQQQGQQALEQGQQAGDQQAQQADQSHGHALEQQQQQAVLTPPPEGSEP